MGLRAHLGRDCRLAMALGAAILLLAGCKTVGPDYSRPNVPTPPAYRGPEPTEAPPGETVPLGEQAWAEVFQDEALQQLIRKAIAENYDVQIAAARVLQAEALAGVARADQLPGVDAGAEISNQRIPQGQFPAATTTRIGLDLSVAWEADFWGKYRRANEAARAELLANDWARRAVISTLVADVAASYFRLRELDLELEISRRTLASRQESLSLIQDLADQGLVSTLDVRQSEQLVYTAGATIPDLERQIEQQENLISTLAGANPGPVPRGRSLTEQPHSPEVPVGLPSALLERRPDIQQAEQQLVAFNARIGVARAAMFPQIGLTGAGGVQSTALGTAVSGPAGFWAAAGSLIQPIFDGGRIQSNIEFAEAQRQEALLVYQQTIQQAFREVSDALVGYRKSQALRQQQQLLAAAAQDASELSGMRYESGITSYLEVLTNETNYFSAELGLAQARAEELFALVQLYRALGGDWQH